MKCGTRSNKIRNTKYFLFLHGILLCGILLLAGCKEAPAEAPESPDDRHITWQTDRVRTVSTHGMEDGAFYVEHTEEDGTKTYYVLGTPVSRDGNLYYKAGQEDIPTLFLGQGDRLVYHSYTKLLRDIYLERLEDLGYTIGIYDISSMENGRCYLSTGADHVLPLCDDAGFLEEQEAEDILIDEMGPWLPSGYTFGEPEEGKLTWTMKAGEILTFYDGLTLTATRSLLDYDRTGFRPDAPELSGLRYPKLTADSLQEGILYGLEKGGKYHLEYYSGTYYASSDMTADIHIFTVKEYYHTNQYSLLQGTLFEVRLPGLPDGIYSAGTTPGSDQKTFRLIGGKEYSADDTFDEFLFPEGVYGIASGTDAYNRLYMKAGIRDVTLFPDAGTGSYAGCCFRYETEDDGAGTDNGISWYYGERETVLGRILDRHADFFTGIREGWQEDGVLLTVTELPEGTYIIRCFGNPAVPVDIPLAGNVLYETFPQADILFLRGSGISLDCRPGTTGILVLNAVRSGETGRTEGKEGIR